MEKRGHDSAVPGEAQERTTVVNGTRLILARSACLYKESHTAPIENRCRVLSCRGGRI